MIEIDCAHYVHYYEAERIRDEMIRYFRNGQAG